MPKYLFYKLTYFVCCFTYPNNVGWIAFVQYPTHTKITCKLNIKPGTYNIRICDFGDARINYQNTGKCDDYFRLAIGANGECNIDMIQGFFINKFVGKTMKLYAGNEELACGIISWSEK